MRSTAVRRGVLFGLLVLSCGLSEFAASLLPLMIKKTYVEVEFYRSWNVVRIMVSTLTLSALTTLTLGWLGAIGLKPKTLLRLFLVTLGGTLVGVAGLETIFYWSRTYPGALTEALTTVSLLGAASLAGLLVGWLELHLLKDRLLMGRTWPILVMTAWFCSMIVFLFVVHQFSQLTPP